MAGLAGVQLKSKKSKIHAKEKNPAIFNFLK
jgi:hypothetical protein